MRLYQRFIPVVLISAVWLLFTAPFFIQGKIPYPATYQVTFFSPWSAYSEFGQPVRNNAMPDIVGQIYPWKKLTIDTWKMGQIPLWNPYSFSGTPHLANYQSAVLSPINLLFFVFSHVIAWSLLILLQFLLAGIFTYIYVRSLNVSMFGSTLSAIGFMFCGFITCWGSYGTLGYAILFLPLSLYAVEKYFGTKKIKYLILLAATVPLSFFSGHFQISIYFFLTIVLYIFYKFFTTKSKNDFLLTTYFLGCGLLLAMPQILPSIEFYYQSLRSNLFQKAEAIPWGYLPTFFSPDFFGNPVTRNDWFGHYAEWNVYVGLFPTLFAFYAIIRKRLSIIYFFTGLTIFVLLLSFQSPLLDLMVVLHIPVLSTSAASRIIVLASFSLVVLAGVGFDYFIKDLQLRKVKYLRYWLLGICVGFSILWGIVIFRLFIPVDKFQIAQSNLRLPTFMLIILIAITIYTFYSKKKLLFLKLIIILIIILDMLRFSSKWQPFESRSLVFPDINVTRFLKTISGYNRAIGNYGGEVSVYYRIPSLEGYDPLYINHYGQFIATLQDGVFKNAERSVVNFPKHGLFTPQAINLLGVKYIIHKISDGRNGWAFPFWKYPQDQFERIFHDGNYEILKNKAVYPRAFFVKEYQVEKNGRKVISELFKNNKDREKVFLNKNLNIKFTSSIGDAKIISYTPNSVVISTKSKQNSLLVLTDAYYPGWNAYVDGKKVEVYQANYAFRAVVVQSGIHRVEFKYQPMSFYIGIYFFGIGFLGMSIVIVLKNLLINEN